MPTYTVQHPDGRTLKIDGPTPPTEADLDQIFQSVTTKPSAPIAAAPGPKPGTMQSELDRFKGWQDVATGAARSVAGTLSGVGKLIGADGPLQHTLERAAEPANPNQALGKTAGNVAQFFLPAGAVGKLKVATETGVGLLDAVMGAGIEGAASAGVQSAQQGTTQGAGKTALTAGGANLALRGAGAGLGWMSERIERAMVKPTAADVKDGFNAKNVFKYNVGGNLSQSYDKVTQKIQSLSTQLRSVLRNSNGPDVDLADVYAKTLHDFSGNKQADDAVGRILEKIEFELNANGVPMGQGKLNAADANVAKQAVGELGAWLHNPAGKTVSDADVVTERVANTFYGHLKTQIEQSVTGPVKLINQQIADLIPIKQAIIRRIPVEQRQNVINLGDLIGYSTGTWGIALANRVLRSGQAANVMNKTAQQAVPLAAAASRGAGSVSATTTPAR